MQKELVKSRNGTLLSPKLFTGRAFRLAYNSTQVYDIKLLQQEYLQHGGFITADKMTSLSPHVYETRMTFYPSF